MSAGSIYLVAPNGALSAMRPGAPPNEDRMQELVAAHPELIADRDGSLLLIRREQPIGDAPDGSGRWSLDHLFVTREAVPVLVEIKRAIDVRLRREVVGRKRPGFVDEAERRAIRDGFAKVVTFLKPEIWVAFRNFRSVHTLTAQVVRR